MATDVPAPSDWLSSLADNKGIRRLADRYRRGDRSGHSSTVSSSSHQQALDSICRRYHMRISLPCTCNWVCGNGQGVQLLLELLASGATQAIIVSVTSGSSSDGQDTIQFAVVAGQPVGNPGSGQLHECFVWW
jgi:hypothetical protein